MSFGNFARKVRDPTLPHGYRVTALRSCVQLYRPIGFHATLGFLEAQTGPFQHDERALLDALELIESSRAARQAEVHDYAARRRQAKQRGERTPRTGETNPYLRAHWYGAPQEGALFALRFWRRRRSVPFSPPDHVARELIRCVDVCLESSGHLTPEDHRLLAACIDQLQQRIRGGLYLDDPMAYFRTRDLLVVAKHIETATQPVV